jgi:hypothetical protein
MTGGELKTLLEGFQGDLKDHKELWGRSLDRTIPAYPITGGAIQVMLSESSCYLRPGAGIEERGGCREHYDSARRMSPVWIKMV